MYNIQPHKETTYAIVFNLSEAAEGLYLPIAYVVTLDQEGYLAHIVQRATQDTITSFDLELTEERSNMFKIVDNLQVKALAKKFSPPKRKVKPLDALLADPELKKVIFKYVHRELDLLLSVIVEKDYPLTWHVARKVLVKDFLLKTDTTPLIPELSFEKTHDSVLYRLKLVRDTKIWLISQHEVVAVSNHPAWILIDDCLYSIRHINGNMVKPFRQRDIVKIPQKQVKTYFQKFILKVADKLDIQATGFDVVYFDNLQNAQIHIAESPFDGAVRLLLLFAYPHAQFNWKDNKRKRTTLEFKEDEVSIIQVRRNQESEQAFIRKLEGIGMVNQIGSFFEIPEASEENPWFMAEWLSQNRNQLEQLGFQVPDTTINERLLYLHQPQLDLSSEKDNDWFDIYGQVTVGIYTFPFKKLAKYIRNNDRFYPLPDGKVFLIPKEWMNRYRSLMQFATAEGDQLKLNKSQFTLLEELGISDETDVTENLSEIEFVMPEGLKATLRPYQLEGVKWLVQLYRNDLGACLADDMGLGKTLQTITILLHARDQKKERTTTTSDSQEVGPAEVQQLNMFERAADDDFLNPLQALIILPASLVFNWESEIQKFAPDLIVYKHVGQKRQKDPRVLRRHDVLLTTYQTALRDVDILAEMEFEYIVLDESQQIKNRESKVFKAINRLQGRHKISLSGTPIENSLSDLWSQMQFINPNLLGSFSFFKREFITPIEKYQEEEKKERLRGLVAPYLLRRTKEEVAGDLPPLTTKIFYSEMTKEQKRMYEREKSAARNYLLENFDENNPKYRILVLQSLTKLRQIVNHPVLVNPAYERDSGKMLDILEHWNVIRRSDHKALFFSSFVQYLNLFRTEFQSNNQDFAWLTGSIPALQRKAEIDRFENDPNVQSFLISIKSGGTGLNLTAADYVFILDPWWNPTTEQQAIARAHRIGQEKNVIAVKFITKDSIEEKILKLQERKSRLAEDIIDNVRKPTFSRGDLEYLLD
ncbi:MAG: DEAD/DEAH box helicase [Saprospiraceae bacterium]|nr:DEAD/DEAH box helicase [Saprospiraceae bacterium]